MPSDWSRVEAKRTSEEPEERRHVGHRNLPPPPTFRKKPTHLEQTTAGATRSLAVHHAFRAFGRFNRTYSGLSVTRNRTRRGTHKTLTGERCTGKRGGSLARTRDQHKCQKQKNDRAPPMLVRRRASADDSTLKVFGNNRDRAFRLTWARPKTIAEVDKARSIAHSGWKVCPHGRTATSSTSSS